MLHSNVGINVVSLNGNLIRNQYTLSVKAIFNKINGSNNTNFDIVKLYYPLVGQKKNWHWIDNIHVPAHSYSRVVDTVCIWVHIPGASNKTSTACHYTLHIFKSIIHVSQWAIKNTGLTKVVHAHFWVTKLGILLLLSKYISLYY